MRITQRNFDTVGSIVDCFRGKAKVGRDKRQSETFRFNFDHRAALIPNRGKHHELSGFRNSHALLMRRISKEIDIRLLIRPSLEIVLQRASAHHHQRNVVNLIPYALKYTNAFLSTNATIKNCIPLR